MIVTLIASSDGARHLASKFRIKDGNTFGSDSLPTKIPRKMILREKTLAITDSLSDQRRTDAETS